MRKPLKGTSLPYNRKPLTWTYRNHNNIRCRVRDSRGHPITEFQGINPDTWIPSDSPQFAKDMLRMLHIQKRKILVLEKLLKTRDEQKFPATHVTEKHLFVLGDLDPSLCETCGSHYSHERHPKD